MTAAVAQVQQRFPRTVSLRGSGDVTLRLMMPGDAKRIVAFARALPESDLLFLQVDITDPNTVAAWVQSDLDGRSLTLLAEEDGAIAGYGALLFNLTTWQRHLGEIRILAGTRYRGVGLGRTLAAELFQVAGTLGLRKLSARMPRDQEGAKATFERLGFRPEALLQNYVIDRQGMTHDLVLMTFDMEDGAEETA